MTLFTPIHLLCRKRILIVLVLLAAGMGTVFSQSISTYWTYKNPAPLGIITNDIDYVNDQVGYACGDAGVIARTTDGGHTWVYDYLPTREVLYSIQFVNATTGYAVGDAGCVVKTVNGGITWTLTGTRPVALQLTNLHFFDANTGIVVGNTSGTSATIFKTTDGGNTWTSLAAGFPVQNKNIQAIAFLDANVGYASGVSGLVARTTDGGTTWTNVSLVSGNPTQGSGSGGTAYTQSFPGLGVVDAQTVLVSSQNNSFIVKSTNGGATWTIKAAQTGIGAPNIIGGSLQMLNMVVKGNVVAVSAGSSCGVSPDKGETWTFKRLFSSVNGSIQFNAVDITPGNNIKLSGAYGVVADSVAGAPSWDTSYYKNVYYHPTIAQNLNAVSFMDKNNVLVSGVNGHIYRSADGGKNWVDRSIPEFTGPLYVPVSINDVRYLSPDATFMACSNGYIYKSTDAGDTWPDQYAYGTGRTLWGMDFVDNKTGWVCGSSNVAGTGTIYRTTDGGLTWAFQANTLTGATAIYGIDFIDKNTGWVVGGSTTRIFKTTDGGINWAPQTGPATVTAALNSVNFVNADTGYAVGNSGKIIRTIDGGTTWTEQTSGVTASLYKVVFVDGKNGAAFGTGGTCLRTSDAGVTWTKYMAPTNDVLSGAAIAGTPAPGGDVDMMVVGGRLIAGRVPLILGLKYRHNPGTPPVPAIINVNNKCAAASTAKGKLMNPPAYTQIDITIDGTPVLYYPNDSSFIYYTAGVTTAGNHAVNVKYTNAGGVSQKDTSYLYVAVMSTPTVTISSNDADNIICAGQPVTFNAVITNGGAQPAYQWKVNGNNSGTNSSSFTYIPANNDVVSVVLTSNAYCITSATATSNSITIEVPQLNPVIVKGPYNVIRLNVVNSNATYQWYWNGQPIPGATATNYSPTLYGTYTVIESSRTCSAVSNAIVIGPGRDVVLYPVPARTELFVQSGNAGSLIQSITIYDEKGSLVGTYYFGNANIVKLDVSRLPQAAYLAKIRTTSGEVTRKFVRMQ